LVTPPLPPQQDGEEKWTKGKTHGLRYRQFNKATKEILLLLLLIIIILIIINMQNKLYIIQFFSPPDDQSAAVAVGLVHGEKPVSSRCPRTDFNLY